MKRLAAGLRALGLKREERVLLLMQDGNDWPVSFLGAMYAGVVPVAVNTLLTADDYAYMLEHSRARRCWCRRAAAGADRRADQVGSRGAEGHRLAPVGAAAPGRSRVRGLPRRADADGQTRRHRPDDPGFWLYSSGSTGRPRARCTRTPIPYWTAELYGKAILGLTERDVCFSAAKLFFAYGLGNAR